MGMQFPLTPLDAEHARAAPTVGAAHVADDETAGVREPSRALYASTVCEAPAEPTAIETGPTTVFTRRSIGAA